MGFSELEADPSRELAVGLLGLAQISRAVKALAHLQQVCGQVAAPDVDSEPLDYAPTGDDGSSRLPKRAPLARTQFRPIPGRGAQRACERCELRHNASLNRRGPCGIGPGPDSRAGAPPAAFRLRRSAPPIVRTPNPTPLRRRAMPTPMPKFESCAAM